MFNEILVGRFNKGLNGIFGIKSGAPSPSLAGDLSPQYGVDERVEDRYMFGWARWACAVSLLGGAAANAVLRLSNPAGINLLVVIERIKIALVNDAAAQTIQIGKSATAAQAGDVAAVLCQLDGRQNVPGSQNASATVVTNTTQIEPAMQFIELYVIGANSGTVIDTLQFTQNHELPVTPGENFFIAHANVNKQIQTTVWWRERFLEPSELR